MISCNLEKLTENSHVATLYLTPMNSTQVDTSRIKVQSESRLYEVSETFHRPTLRTLHIIPLLLSDVECVPLEVW